MSRNPAVCGRARSVRAEFDLTDQNASGVASICHRLDGLPLALEFAAARVKVLSIDEIRMRLDDRFKLLVSSRRTAEPRQRTLLATLAWSYEMLTVEERLVLDRLGVFAGGFTLDAAEQVGAPENVAKSRVLDILETLVDKSLVHAEPKGDGALRYRLHETVRQFGVEHVSTVSSRALVTRTLDTMRAWQVQRILHCGAAISRAG